jgi:hypothetical protein
MKLTGALLSFEEEPESLEHHQTMHAAGKASPTANCSHWGLDGWR